MLLIFTRTIAQKLLLVCFTSFLAINCAFAQAPTITTFSPTTGPTGTVITITGLNLDGTQTINIGGVNAIVISNTGTQAVAMVMPGAVTGTISLANAGGTARGTGNFTVVPTPFPVYQQGQMFSDNDDDFTGLRRYFGMYTTLSADGNTAAIGEGHYITPNQYIYVYGRTNGVWTRQNFFSQSAYIRGCARLSADGNTMLTNQGIFTRDAAGNWSTQPIQLLSDSNSIYDDLYNENLALSADGKTAAYCVLDQSQFLSTSLVVYVRNADGSWTQQGGLLMPADGSLMRNVSISADGNHLMAGTGDNNVVFYIRNNGAWVQLGATLTGEGGVALPKPDNRTQTTLNADGTTAVLVTGGDGNAFVFTRNGQTWAQQGPNLIGTAGDQTIPISSAALSADGNTLIIGKTDDNSGRGSVLIFTRKGGTWTQQSKTLSGTGGNGSLRLGISLALSADGKTAIAGASGLYFNQLQYKAVAGQAVFFSAIQAIPAIPAITSFSPATGPVGTLVTVTGLNLDSTKTLNIGGVNAIIISNTNTRAVAMVMPGAVSGNISLINPGGTATGNGNFTVTATPFPSVQQGAKLQQLIFAGGGRGGVVQPSLVQQGWAVAISADGNTAVVGSPLLPGALVYVRNNSAWTLAVTLNRSGSSSLEGATVGISADGGTIITGGLAGFNSSSINIYARIGNTWNLQGSEPGLSQNDQAYISADGNTIVANQQIAYGNPVTAIVYTRNNRIWAQQGATIAGSIMGISADGHTVIGYNSASQTMVTYTLINGSWIQNGDLGAPYGPAALSADGNVAIIGIGHFPDVDQTPGAVSFYTRTGNTWAQQGPAVTNAAGGSFGTSVSLSADGNTAIIGAPNADIAWIYTRSGNTWVPQGTGISGYDRTPAQPPYYENNSSSQGFSVAISPDGRTGLVGGHTDAVEGAAWVYVDSPILPSAVPPVITSFSPAKGAVGTTITITGTNFNTTATSNVIFFGATQATVSAATATSLTVTLPAGATYGPITELNTGTTLAAYSKTNFTPTFNPTKNSIAVSDFAPKVDFASGGAQTVVIKDINGDGKADMVVSNISTNTVSVFINTGTSGAPAFAAKVDFATGGRPEFMAVGDIDGDGKPDIATANYGDNTVSILRNLSTVGTVNFAAKVDLPAGVVPVGIAIADLDGDGKPDLAITDSYNLMSVYHNIGSSGSITTGSFEPKVDFLTGPTTTGAYAIAIADLNGDGKPDIAVANQAANSVSVFLNTSAAGSINTGSFAPQMSFAVGGAPSGLAIGDLNGDGKADLVVGNFDSNSASVLLNTTNNNLLSFADHIDLGTGNRPIGVAIGDINGDGKPDLAVVNFNYGDPGLSTVSVFCNTTTGGTLSFGDKIDLTTGGNPVIAAIGDLDGDGMPDLAVANNAGSVSVIRNLPIPPVITSFSPASAIAGAPVTITGTYFTGATAITFGGTAAASFTVNSDTQITAFVGAGASGSVNVTTAGGTSTLAGFTFVAPPIITSFSPARGPVGTVVTITGTGFNTIAGLNVVFFGATKASVITATATSISVYVPKYATYGPITVLNYTNKLSAYSNQTYTPTYSPNKNSIAVNDFAPKVDFASGGAAQTVVIKDINGDGKADMVVLNYNTSTVSVFVNTGTAGAPAFAAKVDFATGLNPAFLAVADIDGDGKPDIATANYGGNTVSILQNISSVATVSFFAKVDLPAGIVPQDIAIADLDGDGRPDLAIAAGNNLMSVFHNIGSGNAINTAWFAPKVDFITGNSAYAITIGDLDGDGKPDIAVTNQSDNTVSVYKNTSNAGSINTGSFAAQLTFPVGGAPSSIAIGDLNGDGKADIVVGNFNSNSASVLLNTSNSGAINFATHADLATGNYPIGVAIGDINGDGKPDLALANNNSGTPDNSSVSLLLNTSNGSLSFADKVDLSTGANPVNLAIGDLDSDGKPDLVVANSVSGTVSVIRNAAIAPPVTAALMGSFSSITTTSATANWTNGNGASRAVFISLKNGVAPAFPTAVDGTTYTANANFGTGTQVGTSGWYCVYNGSASTAILSTLTSGTLYRVAAVEYNGTAGAEKYLNSTTGGSAGNFTTVLTVPSTAAIVNGFTNVTAISATANWTNGNGTSRAVFISLKNGLSPAFPTAVDGTTYTANANFGAGTQVGTSGWYCVYRGSGSAANLNALTAATLYRVAVVEYLGSTGAEKYLNSTTGGSAGNLLTLLTPPTTAAIMGGFTNVTTTSATANWTNGSGAKRAVFISLKNGLASAFPTAVDGTTYSANASFGVGTQVGTSGWYCIYNGIASTANLTALTAGTQYRVAAVEYNGAAGTEKYLNSITGGSAGNFTTALATPTTAALMKSFSNITTTGATANWTNGNGTSRAVFISLKNGLSPAFPTAVDGTSYVANTNFGTGTQVGTSGWYCVYNGGASTANLSSLSAGTQYRVAVVEYLGSPGAEKYLNSITGGSAANFSTIMTRPTSHAILLTFTGTTNNSTTVGWTNGNGTARTVFIAAVNTLAPANGVPAPVDGTSYTPSTTFGSGAQIGSTLWYSIYDGTGSSVTVTGLLPGVTYRVMVLEYDAVAGIQYISTSGGSPAMFTTTHTGIGATNQGFIMASLINNSPQAPIEAANLLSPNDDGKNDTWVVKNIEQYPGNQVTVTDQAGNTVFTQKSYANNWGGTYRGNLLTEGTYYYLIDLGNGTTLKGFITVVRD